MPLRKPEAAPLGRPGRIATVISRRLRARGNSALRRYLGSVSSQVVAQADCTVTVVRVPSELAGASE
jgi:nucleotide-binding universal stress UspA family protein